MPKNIVYLADCMDIMKNMGDNSIDLCITDPPYGIGAGTMTMGRGSGNDIGRHNKKIWDGSIPNEYYFLELFRISKNQVIWGGNYFIDFLHNTSCLLLWDKKDYNSDFASHEVAWTSFNKPVKCFIRARSQGGDSIGKIHPTQKPVTLYKWLLKNYAKPGDKIFDSHVGSGSIRIACHDLGFDFEGCEIDEDYWRAQEERYKNHIAQADLFSAEETQRLVYNDLPLD